METEVIPLEGGVPDFSKSGSFHRHAHSREWRRANIRGAP
jgi:hypothetical protein